MEEIIYNPLQLREIFHLEFLRWLAFRTRAESYALKGGCNMRFFFNSIRYSEDMDLDTKAISVEFLKEVVMGILNSSSFQSNLNSFGIEKVVPPDITRAKQTQTTQRFKIHLLTFAGEDLYTKVEFSRRGFKGKVLIQTVLNPVLRRYKLNPLVVSHYDIFSAILQKINALSRRAVIQPRDIFDLYILSSQYSPSFKREDNKLNIADIKKARDRLYEVSFKQFRDTVVVYLPSEDKGNYERQSVWDEILLKVDRFIEEVQ